METDIVGNTQLATLRQTGGSVWDIQEIGNIADLLHGVIFPWYTLNQEDVNVVHPYSCKISLVWLLTGFSPYKGNDYTDISCVKLLTYTHLISG